MRVDDLRPLPDHRTQFLWSHHVTVPEQPGCYVLATYAEEVLYVGLASKSIRDRMGSHLDTAEKRRGAAVGVPFWFLYLVGSPSEVFRIERGWMNQAVLADGEMPPLNRVQSPL